MKHITITGSLGSGKSVVSAILKERLGIEIESIGSILRKMAQNYGMSTTEFNKYIEEHPEVDHELDAFVREQGLSTVPKIFDSRLAWHFVPQSFKIYLFVKDEIAAGRVYSDDKRVNEKYASKDDAQFQISERRKSEIFRFKTQYNVDLDNFTNYNLVIDTSHSTPEDIANAIIENYQKNASGQNDIWLSPHTLLPTKLSEMENGFALFTKKEDFINAPVSAFFDSNNFYIFDGHKRVLSALKNKITLISCSLLNPAGETELPGGQPVKEYIAGYFSDALYSNWKKLAEG